MIEALEARVNGDAALVRRGRFLTTTFLPSSDFALRAPEEEWQKFWLKRPPPGSNDLLALIKRRVLRAEGDLPVFMANLRYFKEALAKLRPAGAGA
jgi:hypothetical protein